MKMKKFLPAVPPVLFLALFSFSQTAQAPPPNPFAPPLAKIQYAPDRDYDLLHIALTLKTDAAKRSFSAEVVNRLAPLRDSLSVIVFDCGDNLEVESCFIDGVAAKFTRGGGKLAIAAPEPLPRGAAVSAAVRYTCPDGAAGFHWIKPLPAEPRRTGFWTIGQPERNRTWVPTWDYPNDFATTETTVSVPADWTVIGNGAQISDALDPGGKTRTVHWKMDQPCATYLLSLTAGPLDVVRSDWRGVPLIYSVPKGKGNRIAETFGETPAFLSFYSDLLGVPYPWPKYAQSIMADGSGGMENVSATLFGEDVLADPRRGIPTSAGTIAHEMVHQWFGDLVTYRSWGEVWIGEGFAILLGQMLYTEHWLGANEFDHECEDHIVQGYLAESRRYKHPLATRLYSGPDDMYDNHSYLKGGLVLHTLRRFLGDEAFFRGLRHYLTKFRNSPADSHDLCSALTEEIGINLEPFFDQWVFKPGHPVLDYSWTWDGSKKEVALTVKQTQDTTDGTPIYDWPVTVGLISGERLARQKSRIDKAEQVLRIGAAVRPDAVLLDPDHDFLREIPALHWAANELPHIMNHAANAVDRQEAMARRLEGSPSDEIVNGAIAALRADDSAFPIFRSLEKLAALKRPDLRPFFREQLSHPCIARRSQAVLALAILPKTAADMETLGRLIDEKQPYEVVEAALRALRDWDAPVNRAAFKKALGVAPARPIIRFVALQALARADAQEGQARPDSDPRATRLASDILTAIAGSAKDSPFMTAGMRELAARPSVAASVALWLKEKSSFTLLARENASAAGMERRGSPIRRLDTYEMVTGKRTIFLVFYLTADGKFADLDVYRE